MLRYLSAILILFFLSCEKIELPTPSPGNEPSPIFSITGNFGTEPIGLAAGKNNVVLKTGYDLLNYQNVQLYGILTDASCNNDCKSVFKMNLRQKLSDFTGAAGVIKTGKRSFYRLVRDSILLKIQNASTLSSIGNAKYKYAWTLNDRPFSDAESIALPLIGKSAKLCLTITHPDNSTAMQCQIIDLNPLDEITGLKVRIIENTSGKTTKLEAKVAGRGSFKYEWENLNAKESIVEIDDKNTYQCVKVYDEFGNVATDCVSLNGAGKIKSKAEYTISFDRNQLLDIAQYNTCEFIYIDSKGMIWRSSLKEQLPSSSFEITEDTAYELNENKQPTRKLFIKLDAVLFNALGHSIPIKLTGYSAVAVPK